MKMNSPMSGHAGLTPPLLIDVAYYERLRGFARLAMRDAPEVAERLLEEVERAEVVPSGLMPADVVTIGASVTYQDVETGSIRTVRLVLPADADPAAQRVSVVSPIGAALIGLSIGQVIDWQVGDRVRRLRVLGVRH
ncbi:nucleoside diphosphate kinase regulator [Fontimonas sp. SYSU GA230001]|uniref:nucleoside diphosphate kinase regulator n=1 Tax=Fontimonas sp. SYSU GA230001 TaxID=3142450 RepID=UPI0032B41E99